VEGAESNPVVIISSSSSSSSSSSAEGETETGHVEETLEPTAYLDASAYSSTRDLDEETMEVEAMEEASETQQDIADNLGGKGLATQCTTSRATSPFGTASIASAVRLDPPTSSASTTSGDSAVTAATSPTLASHIAFSEQAPAEPKARVQHRSISEAKQQPPGKGRKKMTARAPTVKTTTNTAITYNEHYHGRPFPGMPQHTLLQTQYAGIAQKMSNTQVNTAVVVTEQEAEMLRALPEQLIGGRWITKNTDDSEYSYGCMHSYEFVKHSEQRENSLVFVPSARLAAEEAVASVKPPKDTKIQPTADCMIVIIVSSPEERKKRAMEGSRLFHPELARKIPVSVRSGNTRDFGNGEGGRDNDGGDVSTPSSDSEASEAMPTPTRRSSHGKKRIRSPSVQDEEEESERNENSLRQRPKRSSAGVKGAILDLQAKELLPRRGARSVSSASASASMAGSEGGRAGLSSPPAGSARRHSSAGESSRRNVVSPSNSSHTAAATSTRATAGRHSLGATSSNSASASANATAGSKGKGVRTVHSACHDIMHSRDNQDLINGVNFLGTATSKSNPYLILLRCSTYTIITFYFIIFVCRW